MLRVPVSVRVLLIGALLLLAGGCCGAEPKAWNVRVSLDEETWRRAYPNQQVPPYRFEVDVIGVNASERGNLENYPVANYFTPNDQRRRDADQVTLMFEPGQSQAQVHPQDSAKWKSWRSKGVDHLIVVGNLQGVDVQQGASDPRRVVLPVACNAWKAKNNTLEIVVKSSSIVNATERKPADKPLFGG